MKTVTKEYFPGLMHLLSTRKPPTPKIFPKDFRKSLALTSHVLGRMLSFQHLTGLTMLFPSNSSHSGLSSDFLSVRMCESPPTSPSWWRLDKRKPLFSLCYSVHLTSSLNVENQPYLLFFICWWIKLVLLPPPSPCLPSLLASAYCLWTKFGFFNFSPLKMVFPRKLMGSACK